MVPKTTVKRKAAATAQGHASADIRKTQRVSSESVESLPTDSETAPSLNASPGVEEMPATDGAIVAGPS